MGSGKELLLEMWNTKDERLKVKGFWSKAPMTQGPNDLIAKITLTLERINT